MTYATVNGHPADPGCYVDGHCGQYAPDRLADVAESFGWRPFDVVDDDPRTLRRIADTLERVDGADAHHDPVWLTLWERHTETADAILDWLNHHTPGLWLWDWQDGEIFLFAVDEEGEPIE